MRAWTNRFALVAVMLATSVQAQTSAVPPGTGTRANPYLISQVAHLVWISENVASSSGRYYTMQNDIDASATSNSTWNAGAGFAPIGTNNTPFLGVFDGNGKAIERLTINRPSQNNAGLFGYVGNGGVVKNVGLVGALDNGCGGVGSLAGINAGGTVSNCYATGQVNGSESFVGGLVGLNYYGTVRDSYAAVAVTGSNFVGGLVGNGNLGSSVIGCRAAGAVTGNTSVGGLAGWNQGVVSGCNATGAVTGAQYVGGLVGANNSITGMVSWCYATGPVVGSNCVGALAGVNNHGVISNNFAAGPVQGNGDATGGLVGWNYGSLIACYAVGAVTGSNSIGGLVGENYSTVRGCYAVGGVTGDALGTVGGLVGFSDGGTVSNSYWDTNTTGQVVSFGGGTGTNTAALMQQSTFAGWDFANVWRINAGVSYPFFGVAAVLPPGDGTLANPYQISQLAHLVWMGDTVGSSSGQYYTMQNDIDALVTMNWEGGAGFVPIGTNTAFVGIFNGNSKVISNLTINRPSQDYVGLFGYIGSSGVVGNLGLSGGTIEGWSCVGGLAGYNNGGTVSGCYMAGPVTGYEYVGGLVGYGRGTVSECYAAGSVAGTGYYYVGGLVGFQYDGDVISCYALGSVTGSTSVGGLVGRNNTGLLSDCYAAGSVTGTSPIGGLVGQNGGMIANCYWDTNATGMATSAGGAGATGKTTAQMKQKATFVGWDFTNVWRITENRTYPLLRRFSGPMTSLSWLSLLLGQ